MKKANFLFFAHLSKALFILLMVMSFSNEVNAQCTLSCNNLVQVSLDADCSVALLPDQIVEGDINMQCPNGNLVVQVKQNNTWVPGVLNANHIGTTVQVRVLDLVSGQTCWGYVAVEDKLGPTLVCQDVTLSCASIDPSATSFPQNLGPAPVVTDNCSNATVSFSDNFTSLTCNDPFSARLERTWTATDASGNFSTCVQTFFFERSTLAQVICPIDVNIDCAANFQADANGNPTPNWIRQNFGAPAAAPHIGGINLFPSAGACEINTIYTDQVIPVCDGTRKILRTWTIANWCEPTIQGINPKVCVQLIKIEDATGPVVQCPDNLTVSTNPFDCQRDLNLPDVIIEDACSRIASIKAQVTVNGVTQTINGSLQSFPGNNLWTPDTLGVVGIANNLPIGTHNVTYTVTDDCGNSSVCSFRCTVEDQIQPVAICDEHTVVSLGYDGRVQVPASVFDDGSYDNCGPVYYKVRKMERFTCAKENVDTPGEIGDPLDDTDDQEWFDDKVTFCCAEIGDTITVIFRVYDIDPGAGSVSTRQTSASGFEHTRTVRNGITYDDRFLNGHYNDCMVTVVVQDKLRPVCQAPVNVTVECESFDPSLWAYGTAVGTDNCCLDTVIVNNSFALFDTVCNTGRIIRTFRVVDCAGLFSTCTQSVTVEYNQDYFFEFPNDETVFECDGSGNYGEPIIYDEDCELMGVSFTDEIITVVPDACYKIERTWKVTNWCTYDPNLDCEYVNNPFDSPAGPRLSPFPPNSGNPLEATNIDYFNQYVGQLDNDGNVTANCWIYRQVIKVIDNEDPTATVTQPECDKTDNDAFFYNDMDFYDATINSHDLCEGPADLCINATDLCSGANIRVRYLLFLDLDGDGTMETVINSQNAPATATINTGNANNPSFSGGTPVVFDKRPVPGSRKYRFGLKSTVSGSNVNACVAWKENREYTDPASGVTPELPYGTHKIKWFVEDGCGNEKVEEFNFTISDCKKPTVVCKNGVSVNLMNSNPAMVQLWASDFYKYGEDNCTPADQLKFAVCLNNPNALNEDVCSGSFPLNPNGTPDTMVTFNCSHLGTVLVQVWAIDKAGNADYCEALVSVQDNMGVCGPTTTASVAGALEATASGIAEADVEISGSLLPANLFDLTDNAGHYDFTNVPLGGNYDIKPSKNDDPLNGVNTYDLLLIQKHLLGTQPLDNPYKMIAADINKSGSITPTDIIELRKVILGISATGFPANESWRFVDQSYVFPNPNNPFIAPLPEMINIADLQAQLTDGMFEAVKIGDLDGTALYNATTPVDDRTVGTVNLDVADRDVVAGDIVTVRFQSTDAAAAYQFTMNTKGLEVVELLPGAGMTESNFAVFAAQRALTAAIDAEATEFAITFRATAAGTLSEMLSLSNSITETLAFDAEGARKEVTLRFDGQTTLAGAAFELMQNMPNPVANQTNISFVLPEAASASLTITNVEGRIIRTVHGDFAKGLNTIILDRAGLETGVLFYQLDTPTHSAVKKMVVID